jgi:hypothetical protein
VTDRATPESARTCIVCGTAGTLGQYIDINDLIVWAHLRCAAIRELEAVDGGIMREQWDDV